MKYGAVKLVKSHISAYNLATKSQIGFYFESVLIFCAGVPAIALSNTKETCFSLKEC